MQQPASYHAALLPLGRRQRGVRLELQDCDVTSAATYPARLASVSELERLSDKARELRLGQAGNPRLWADAIRAIPHVGYAVSTDRMTGLPAEPGDATVWTIAGDLDVLLVVWWIRLRADSIAPAPVFPILITIQPDDYVALDETVIDEAMLAEAHTLAGEFLRDAGHSDFREKAR